MGDRPLVQVRLRGVPPAFATTQSPLWTGCRGGHERNVPSASRTAAVAGKPRPTSSPVIIRSMGPRQAIVVGTSDGLRISDDHWCDGAGHTTPPFVGTVTVCCPTGPVGTTSGGPMSLPVVAPLNATVRLRKAPGRSSRRPAVCRAYAQGLRKRGVRRRAEWRADTSGAARCRCTAPGPIARPSAAAAAAGGPVDGLREQPG